MEHSQAHQAGEVRFGRFGLLSGQNGPPEGEQGAQPCRPSWRGPFWRIWAAQRPKQHSQPDQAGEVRFGGFGLLSGQNGESKEHSQADLAGEVRFGGFGLLSGQNGPPEGEQGAQPSRPSWRGPFWRIWAAERPKRTTGDRDR